jgi:hypothetical protein
MPPHLSPISRHLLALAVQASTFWLVLSVVGPGLVDVRYWLVLHFVLACGLVVLAVAPSPAAQWGASTWLAVAFYAAFLAAFFAGAQFGLDALHGVQRRRYEPAGFALWQFLCPGVFSLALGALSNCLCGKPLAPASETKARRNTSPGRAESGRSRPAVAAEGGLRLHRRLMTRWQRRPRQPGMSGSTSVASCAKDSCQPR